MNGFPRDRQGKWALKSSARCPRKRVWGSLGGKYWVTEGGSQSARESGRRTASGPTDTGTMASTTIACPVLKLAASDDILALTSGTQALVFDISTGKKLASSSAPAEDKLKENAAQLKAKSVRLVVTGYVPSKDGRPGDVEPVVASVTEHKVLRLVQADTGHVFYERYVRLSHYSVRDCSSGLGRTLIKKASYLTIEDDGTVIVSDKNGDVFA